MTNYEWMQQLSYSERTSYDIPRYIYFIQRSDTQAVKIGMTHDPLARFARLQYEYRGIKLSLLGFLNKKLLRDITLHKRFNHLHLEGEWFAAAPDLLSFIDGNTTLDIPELDIDKYRRIHIRSPWRPKCLHCNRLASGNSQLIVSRDPITGKTGAFHKTCYLYRKSCAGDGW